MLFCVVGHCRDDLEEREKNICVIEEGKRVEFVSICKVTLLHHSYIHGHGLKVFMPWEK